MKIAIMFNGQFRWFDSFRRSFLSNFQPALQNHHVQYFAHFWNDDVELIDNFTSLCDPLIIQLENKHSYEESAHFFGMKKKINGTLPHQAYCAYKVFLLLEEYQKQHNTTFDLYIRMRPDIYFPDRIDLNHFEKAYIYSKKCHSETTPFTFHCDFAYFTRSYEVVQKIANFGFHLDQTLEHPETMIYKLSHEPTDTYCAEELLARYIKSIPLWTKYHSFDLDLARHHL